MIFIKILEGKEQLFVAGIDGRDEKQLTHDTFDLEDPAWSPDGGSVAYVRLEGESRKNVLYVMDLATKTTRRLSPPSQSPIHPAWMPDGRSILYCTNDDLDPPRKNASEIYRVEVATGRVATVITGGINTYPVPSPDARWIAFRRIVGEGSNENSEVFVADMDGRNARNISNNEAWEGWPAWSPDGKTIAFAGNRNAAWQIYLANPDGSNLRLLAATEGRGTAPKWAPDGKTIYFTICRNSQERAGCEIYRAPVP
jgi:TolB protein